MSKKNKLIAKIILFVMMFGSVYMLGRNSKPHALAAAEQRAVAAEAELMRISKQEVEDEKLGQYVINMTYMTTAGRAKSDAWKMSFAQDFVQVSKDIFNVENDSQEFSLEEREKRVKEQREAWAGALAIESSFNKMAQSPTGPKGYGQLAKASFHEAMKVCGLKAVDEDVWETKLNLYASACYFKMILKHPKIEKTNDVKGAMIAYNQGMASKDFANYLKGGMTNGIEPLKYISRVNFMLNRTTAEVVPGQTIFKDLTTPLKKPVDFDTVLQGLDLGAANGKKVQTDGVRISQSH